MFSEHTEGTVCLVNTLRDIEVFSEHTEGTLKCLVNTLREH